MIPGSYHKHLAHDPRRARLAMARSSSVRWLLLAALTVGLLMVWLTYTVVGRAAAAGPPS